MVINRPPMGWNSWNTFAENINEKWLWKPQILLLIADSRTADMNM